MEIIHKYFPNDLSTKSEKQNNYVCKFSLNLTKYWTNFKDVHFTSIFWNNAGIAMALIIVFKREI